MYNVIDKYNEQIRPNLKDGDALLCRGVGFFSKAIQWADDAYYSHVVAHVYQDGNRWFGIQAWDKGIEVKPISQIINEAAQGDVCILRLEDTESQVHTRKMFCLDKVYRNEGYDKKLIILELLKLKMNVPEWMLYKFDNPNKYDCSQLFQQSSLTSDHREYLSERLFTPQDAVRLMLRDGSTKLLCV